MSKDPTRDPEAIQTFADRHGIPSWEALLALEEPISIDDYKSAHDPSHADTLPIADRVEAQLVACLIKSCSTLEQFKAAYEVSSSEVVLEAWDDFFCAICNRSNVSFTELFKIGELMPQTNNAHETYITCLFCAVKTFEDLASFAKSLDALELEERQADIDKKRVAIAAELWENCRHLSEFSEAYEAIAAGASKETAEEYLPKLYEAADKLVPEEESFDSVLAFTRKLTMTNSFSEKLYCKCVVRLIRLAETLDNCTVIHAESQIDLEEPHRSELFAEFITKWLEACKDDEQRKALVFRFKQGSEVRLRVLRLAASYLDA